MIIYTCIMAKHHYVSQFYLKKFCDPNTPSGHTPYIWVNDRKNTGWKKSSPANCAYAIDLYSIPSDGSIPADSVEQMFSKIESETAKVYRGCLDTYNFPTREQKEVIALFAACFAIRTPRFRSVIEKFSREPIERLAEMLSSVPGAMENSLSNIGQSPTEADSMREFLSDKNRYTIKIKPEWITAMGLSSLTTIAQMLLDMKWKLLLAPFGERFVTSDSPADWEDPTMKNDFFGNKGLVMPHTEFILPLSPKLALLAGWNYAEGVFPVKKEKVWEISNRVIRHAKKEIYSQVPVNLIPLPKWEATQLFNTGRAFRFK